MRKISALAAAATLTLGLPASNALALVMGNLTVQSSLGEPLRAEVPIPQISRDEAETLRVDVAPPSAFSAQGLEYTASASSVRVEVQQREDGTAVLRLRTNQPIREPFFDLIIDASWLGGKMQRSYTMLLSPPVLQPVPVVIAPELRSAEEQALLDLKPDQPAPGGVRNLTQNRPAATPGGSVQVKRGDTAGRIAAANLPAGVSLDQMLLAILRANPHAFINNNVNLVRSGAVLTLPDAATAQQTPPQEARRLVVAQTRDFNQYRRNVANAAPSAPASRPGQTSTGRVDTRVQDRGDTAPKSPDVLKLDGQQLAHAEADAAARQRQEEEQKARQAEIERNLKEIEDAIAQVPSSETQPDAPQQEPVLEEPPAPPPMPAEPAPPPIQQPTFAPPPPPAEPPPASRPPLAQQEPEAESWLDMLPALDDPLVLGGGGLLVLLLLGYGGYRVVRSRREGAGDTDETTFGSSMGLDDDSMFDSGGGQDINTGATEQSGSTSSMFYSPSQLDAGDVDPIAEADVYLAYGRDQQAEEILREALRTDSSRLGLHAKLGEILAKRGDRQAFEAVATTLHQMTKGEGAEWESLASAGAALDPENPLYQSAASASPRATAATVTPPVPDDMPSAVNPVTLDEPKTTQFFMSTQPAEPAAAPPAPLPPPPPAEPASIFTGESEGFSLDDFLSTTSSSESPTSVAPSMVSATSLSPDSGNSGQNSGQVTSTFVDGAQESLQTKLELAKEFNAIGDADGARALVEEVLSEAPAGDIKDQAQRMLAEMA